MEPKIEQDDQLVEEYISQSKQTKLKQSQVRLRQKTCTIADLKKDEVIFMK
jgi:hypothetical protein